MIEGKKCSNVVLKTRKIGKWVDVSTNDLFKSKKVISCDIAELNPDFDIDDSTANLGARLVDCIVQNT